jgi:2,4-dienoyl-CoA reductase-like NADH-dependent reductase (Old Yellow Enzyme family)
MTDPLLEPFTLGRLTLRNRVVLSAHEPAYSDGGLPGERYFAYQVERARGGVGLTMTAGSAVVSRDSPEAFGNLHAYDDAIVAPLRRLTDELHDLGTAVMLQLTHLGRRSSWAQGDWLPLVAPSAIAEPAHRAMPKEAELWDIRRITGEYGESAERVASAGVDGIEVEAYGHLTDQFLSPLTNHREDAYGGSLDNRMRFLWEVLTAVRERVGSQLLVSLRLVVDEAKDDGLQVGEGVEVLQRLRDAGLIDMVNVIRGWIGSDAALADVIPMHGTPSAPHLEFAGEVRRQVGIPTMHAGKIDDVATARHAVSAGLLDLVGMVRAHLADPHLVHKSMERREEEIRPCVGAMYCLDRLYQGGEALCIHNPASGRELSLPHVVPPAARRRRVVVVGAGPAGLEAGRVAAERGHEVTVLEAMAGPGGQLALATRLPRRRDLSGIVDWRVSALNRLGATMTYDTVADVDGVLALDPDVVVVATGAVPGEPLAGGIASVGWDVLSGAAHPTGDVLLVDGCGSHASLSVAEHLAASGARLTIVTPERTLGVDVGGLTATGYLRALTQAHVTTVLGRTLTDARRHAGRVVCGLASVVATDVLDVEVDHVVVEEMPQANDALYRELVTYSSNGGEVDYDALLAGESQDVGSTGDGFQLFRIGDAVAPRNVHAAVLDALRLAKDL